MSTTGPDFVESVRAFSIYDQNTLLIGSDQYITFITLDGEVTKRLRINDLNSDFSGFDFSNGRLTVNKYSGLQYNGQNKTMLMEVYYFSKRQGFAVNPIIVSLDLEELVIKEFTIPNELSRKEGNYGELRGVNFWRTPDELIVNYKSSSDVVVQKSQNIVSYQMRSKHTTDDAKPIINNSGSLNVTMFEHQVRSSNFYTVIKDQNKGQYYRIHKSPTKEMQDEEEFHLSIASDDFEKYMEIPFPSGYYIFGIPSKEGLLFMAYNKYDDKVELVNYRFELKE